MRFVYFACSVISLATSATLSHAFEIEEHRIYESEVATDELRIISTADVSVFEPLIQLFQRQNPSVSIDYTVASSSELMKAIYQEGAKFDLAISSAMDLQTKLANDGFASTFTSSATDALPDWAKWHDQLFAFTQEPAVLVVSDTAFTGRTLPDTRDELVELLRANENTFRGRIGTYDIRTSGFGYMVATQDSRNTESYWRLTEVMGRLETQLFCCSGAMIDRVASGELAMAYNVLGSYAESRSGPDDGFSIVALQDFSTIMLRTALVPATAENPETAGKMIDFLISSETQSTLADLTGLPPVLREQQEESNALRRIHLGPGLLVFLDKLRRQTFLRNWEASITQQ